MHMHVLTENQRNRNQVLNKSDMPLLLLFCLPFIFHFVSPASQDRN